MANSSTPFGFQAVGLVDGVSPNFGVRTVQIDPTNSNVIAGGDVAGVISGGYYDVATAVGGGAPIGGIFLPFFQWTSISRMDSFPQRVWLGNAADVVPGGTITAKLVINPQALFRVRSLGTTAAAIAQASVGSNANFDAGAGIGANLISTFSLDDATIGAGPSLPFTIVEIEGPPTSDPTANYNIVVVRFNNLVLI